MFYKSGNSLLLYNDNCGIINDYYQNIVTIIKHILENNPDLHINIVLGGNYNFNNNNKTLVISINYEHTLVKKGGRSVPFGTPIGTVKDDTNDNYFVRIDNFDNLNKSDIIIDYSKPNIYNVKTCSLYNSFSKKHIYVYASMYTPYFIKYNRNIVTLTTFINTNEPIRANLLAKIRSEKIEHININNCFKENEMRDIYQKTKILINVHQTPHHHTFEELRVLPALESGVIVISEKSPLIETIPYSDLIIWVNYDDIIEKIKDVIHNYDSLHSSIFSTENIARLRSYSKLNYDVLQHAILEKSS